MSLTPSSSRNILGFLTKTALVPAFVALIALGVSAAPLVDETSDEGVQVGFLPVATSTATSTITPSPTSTFTPAPTATSTSTLSPTPDASFTPSPTPSSTPRGRPQPDGVQRTADVPILMYHYISVPPNPADALRRDLSVAPEDFEAQMKWLAENNYHTITLTDLYYYLAVGTPLPENPIILTFDDGYVDHYEHAFPILQQHGFVGTFFVLAGPADVASPRYLTWDMIAEMSTAGQDIQVHGRDHVDMRRQRDDVLFFQIVGARQAIEAHTGKAAPFYAFPAGRYDANLIRFLTERDFWMAVTIQNGHTHTFDSASELTRIRIRGTDSLRTFVSKVTAGK